MRKIKLFLTAVAAMLSASMAFAQVITVKGVVSDGAGDPIPAAAVLVDGTTKGVTTGIDGAYSINVPSNATLVFSSIGYVEQKVAVNGRAVINVVLSDDTQQLEETIVVAFGTSTKESFTGSAKVVKADELAKAQVSAVTSALAGQVAGVQLAQSTGQPGTAPSIRIRGFSSLNAGKEPLYIVDGAPYDGAIGRINPADVESMTVLKDAASNALYGARGANGVIMITTKKSKSKDAIVTVDAKYGFNTQALKDYDYIKSVPGYYETHALALANYYMREKGTSLQGGFAAANEVITGHQNQGGLGYQVYTVPAGEAFIGNNGKINPGATLGNLITAADGKQYWVEPDNWKQYA
ncbi:MAG: TonB-dependent receptor plug domain-containing protein, partial [Bacteroidales bacterium]|nr:TonB-dependent receptor plug domain-containing protein [Bacteroidales bacterium]